MIRRFVPYSLLTLLPRAALASGVLNVLLAGAIAVLSASASPTSITYSAPGSTITSGSTTCSGHGGIPPYSYAWSWASGGSGISPSSPSTATTSFVVSGATVNTTYTGTAQCQASGREVGSAYADVSVSMTRIPLLPPYDGSATLVAGTTVSGTTTYYGYGTTVVTGGSAIGSLSPSTDYSGYAVVGIYYSDDPGPPHVHGLGVTIPQPSSNANYISHISINGTVYAIGSGVGTYVYTGGYGNWYNSGIANPFVSGDSYNVFYY